MELSGHSPFIVFDDADLKKQLTWLLLLNLEIMVKFVFLLIDFIFMKIKKMNLLDLFIEKTKKLKNW